MVNKQPDTVDATFYAIVRPEWSRYLKDDRGRPVLEGAKVERITQNRPQRLAGDAVLTRLTLRVDASALLPLQPEAVIAVHAGQTEVIHVIADQPEPAEDRT